MSDTAQSITADEARLGIVSVSFLRAILSLDEATGNLTWKPRDVSLFFGEGWKRERACKTWNSRFSGKIASRAGHRGYLKLGIFERSHKAHRVVYALYHGKWPEGSIDHINGIVSDNRPENLRDVPHAENCRNQKLRKTNTSGFNGVCWEDARKAFSARITVNGKAKHIGYFQTAKQASDARTSFSLNSNFHTNHGKPQNERA